MSPTELSELTACIRPVPRAKFEVDCALSAVEEQLSVYERTYGLELAPDFQRGHVWALAQQEHFIESVIRGAVTSAGLLIQFNCAVLNGAASQSDLPSAMQCVDGLQRLTAIRRFVAGDIKAFGRTITQFRDTPFDARCYTFRIALHAFTSRAELLQYYLDLNSGGTPHSPEELARVQSLLEAQRKPKA